MNLSALRLFPITRRMYRASVLVFSFALLVANVSAAPCRRILFHQDDWVNRRVNTLIRAARAAFEDEKARPRYDRILDGIAGTMERCGLNNSRDFVGRFPEFSEYVRVLSLGRKKGHELGFEVPDKVYFEETSAYTAIPDFLLTQQFLRSVSRWETLPRAKALLREVNAGRAADDQLLFFSYESQHLGTPDNPNSFRRLLIVVPGNPSQQVPEKWVQFGITDPRARPRVRNVSVVALLPGVEQTTNVYFKDFFRTYRRNGWISIKGRWELGEGDDNCVECHKSGVLQIFPVEGSVSRNEQPVLAAVNERFLTYGPPRFDRYLDASKFGPGLGSVRPEEPERPAGLFSLIGLKTDETKLDTAQCASCHRPGKLGALNWPIDSVLVNSLVKGGQMPLGSKLQDWERKKLYEQLVHDYFAIDDRRPGILKAWLLGKLRRHSKTETVYQSSGYFPPQINNATVSYTP
jgi:hypothetical protein